MNIESEAKPRSSRVLDTTERIAVVGLGYVGLPVAVAFARHYSHVTGFDISRRRVTGLKRHEDTTGEISSAELAATRLTLSDEPACLAGTTFFVVTVPTPVTDAKRPDLAPLLEACAAIGPYLSKGAIVVFESTVYPGVTEEICGPALEAASGLRLGRDFALGYSPERINPGDRDHRLETIVKVVAAQNDRALARMVATYRSIIDAGLHRAPSIKVAETAKVLENTQRDLNIALMNELAVLTDRLGISTRDVLDAAATKWNFLRFSPGLVGGHCIGVDPYYLTEKAVALGHHPEVILAGRHINDSMGKFIGQKLVRLVVDGRTASGPIHVAVLGLTFKENVPDTRNSKVPDVLAELRSFGVQPMVHDPHCSADAVRSLAGTPPTDPLGLTELDALVLAVPHAEYLRDFDQLVSGLKPGGVVMDIRSALDRARIPATLRYWSL